MTWPASPQNLEYEEYSNHLWSKCGSRAETYRAIHLGDLGAWLPDNDKLESVDRGAEDGDNG